MSPFDDLRAILTPSQAAFLELVDFVENWQIGCAYAAGRASVIESEEMAVVRDAARICAAHNDIEAFEVRGEAPFRSADQSAKAAAIRTALEALR